MLRALLSRVGGGKRLTFLYVPDNASVRQFMVPKVFFYAVGGVVVALLAMLGFFGARYLSAAADGRQALSLRGENMQLRERLEEMQTQIGNLQTEMRSSLEVQQRLRVVASLEELAPQVLEAGVGGPAPAMTSVEALGADTRSQVEDAGRDIVNV